MHLRLFFDTSLLFAVTTACVQIAVADAADLQCLVLPSENIAYGEVDKPAWRSWTGLPELKFLKNEQHLSVDTSLNGNPHLVQRLIPAYNGSHTVTNRSVVPESRTYFLTQSVYLEPGFEWGGIKEGGKLGFGLGGGSSPSGASKSKKGFTARFMWRGNGDGSAHVAVYSYASDRTQNWPFGDDYPLRDFSVPIGEWFDLAMEVTLNSSTNKSDGSVRAWANGKLLLDRRDIQWQASGGTPVIEFLSYGTFYGGNSTDWSPSKTTYSRFANVCWTALDEPGNEPDEPGNEPDPDEPDNEPDPDVSGNNNRQALGDAHALIEQLLPADNGRINWRLNKAKALLVDATGPSGWQSATLPKYDSSVMTNVRAAIKKLISANSANGAQQFQRNVIENVLQLLTVAATNISVVALEELNLLMLNQCDQASSGSCSAARYDFQKAESELQLLQNSNDANAIGYHAGKVWKRINKARNHLASIDAL